MLFSFSNQAERSEIVAIYDAQKDSLLWKVDAQEIWPGIFIKHTTDINTKF